MNKKYCAGIDIGGTTVKIALIDTEGFIAEKWEIPTSLQNAGSSIPYDIWESIKRKMKVSSIKLNQLIGIGAGAPGFVDTNTGFIYQAVNIGWKDYPLGEILRDLSGIPVYVENDANLAALGENWKGSGNRSDNLIAITLGTGVGGGIIVNGSILNGVNGMAGEIGHITVEPGGVLCTCGRMGCLETVASASAISRIATEKVNSKPESKTKLAELYKQNGNLSAKDVFDLAAEKDTVALQIVNHIANVLGMAIANAATLINPSRIVIGGGVSKAGDVLLSPLKEAYSSYALPRVNKASEFVLAELSNDAGVFGGAYLVMEGNS